MRKAVFLDRDGTINSDEGHYYIYRPDDFVLNKGVVEGLRLLQENDFLLIVVTNQGGVAKGEYTEADVDLVHNRMQELLVAEGIILSGVYYCPHHDSIAKCKCRKPLPYMIDKAIEDFQLNRSKCYLIGDSERDIQAAEAAEVNAFKIQKNTSILPICEKIVRNED